MALTVSYPLNFQFILQLSNSYRSFVQADLCMQQKAMPRAERARFAKHCVLCLPFSSSHESSSIIAGQRYLLKWSVPLGQVEAIEYGNVDGQGENCRFPPCHSSENVAVNAQPSE